jgi:hypothetical protein
VQTQQQNKVNVYQGEGGSAERTEPRGSETVSREKHALLSFKCPRNAFESMGQMAHLFQWSLVKFQCLPSVQTSHPHSLSEKTQNTSASAKLVAGRRFRGRAWVMAAAHSVADDRAVTRTSVPTARVAVTVAAAARRCPLQLGSSITARVRPLSPARQRAPPICKFNWLGLAGPGPPARAPSPRSAAPRRAARVAAS